MNFLLTRRTLSVSGSIGLAILGLWLAFSFWSEPKNFSIRMSAGPEGTRRHQVAEYLGELATHHNLTINIKSNTGSIDCLKSLRDGQLDAAIVSNGIIVPDDDEIMVLGAIQTESVHLLVRNGLAEDGKVVRAMRGKRVNLGENGSTEALLAREFLKFAHLKLPSESQAGDIIPTEFGKTQLVAMASRIVQAPEQDKARLLAEMPDCLIVLASMPSTVVQRIIETGEYKIMPLLGSSAFLMDNLQTADPGATMLAREFFETATIPMNSYFAQIGLPESECETIGVRLLVVARKDLAANAVGSLMKTIFDDEFARHIKPTSPRDIATSFAIHPAAQAYLDRGKPLAIGEVLDWFSQGFSLFGAFGAGALSLWGLLRSKHVRTPSDYFSEIRRVNQAAIDSSLDSKVLEPKELASHLDNRIQKMRQDLIEDICEGRIQGDQVIANIISLLKDAEQNLPKIQQSLPRISRITSDLEKPRLRPRPSRSEAA